MCLTAAGLTIREDSAVVPGKSRLDQREGCLIINLALRRINAIHFVVSEEPFIGAALLCADISKSDLLFFLVHVNDLPAFCAANY